MAYDSDTLKATSKNLGIGEDGLVNSTKGTVVFLTHDFIDKEQASKAVNLLETLRPGRFNVASYNEDEKGNYNVYINGSSNWTYESFDVISKLSKSVLEEKVGGDLAEIIEEDKRIRGKINAIDADIEKRLTGKDAQKNLLSFESAEEAESLQTDINNAAYDANIASLSKIDGRWVIAIDAKKMYYSSSEITVDDIITQAKSHRKTVEEKADASKSFIVDGLGAALNVKIKREQEVFVTEKLDNNGQASDLASRLNKIVDGLATPDGQRVIIHEEILKNSTELTTKDLSSQQDAILSSAKEHLAMQRKAIAETNAKTDLPILQKSHLAKLHNAKDWELADSEFGHVYILKSSAQDVRDDVKAKRNELDAAYGFTGDNNVGHGFDVAKVDDKYYVYTTHERLNDKGDAVKIAAADEAEISARKAAIEAISKSATEARASANAAADALKEAEGAVARATENAKKAQTDAGTPQEALKTAQEAATSAKGEFDKAKGLLDAAKERQKIAEAATKQTVDTEGKTKLPTTKRADKKNLTEATAEVARLTGPFEAAELNAKTTAAAVTTAEKAVTDPAKASENAANNLIGATAQAAAAKIQADKAEAEAKKAEAAQKEALKPTAFAKEAENQRVTAEKAAKDAKTAKDAAVTAKTEALKFAPAPATPAPAAPAPAAPAPKTDAPKATAPENKTDSKAPDADKKDAAPKDTPGSTGSIRTDNKDETIADNSVTKSTGTTPPAPAPNLIDANKFGMLGGLGGMLIMMFMGMDPMMAIIGGLVMSLIGSAIDGKDGFLNGVTGMFGGTEPTKGKEPDIKIEKPGAAQPTRGKSDNAGLSVEDEVKAIQAADIHKDGRLNRKDLSAEKQKEFDAYLATPEAKKDKNYESLRNFAGDGKSVADMIKIVRDSDKNQNGSLDRAEQQSAAALLGALASPPAVVPAPVPDAGKSSSK